MATHPLPTLPCIALALCSAAVPALADPLNTPACRQAVAQLELQEAASAALPRGAEDGTRVAQARGVPKSLDTARTQVARVCLRDSADVAPRAGRLAQPPLSVTPERRSPAIAGARRDTPSRPVAVPAPGTTLPRTLTTCDAAGCWASDGTRLQRVGPQLLGPSGFCSSSGAVLQCP